MRSTAGYDSDTLWADFDDPNSVGAVAHEATSAYYDSGAGWFLRADDQWLVAGLTWTSLIHYALGHDGDSLYSQAWFRQNYNPNLLKPDPMDAIRLSSYRRWITAPFDGAVAGDANSDGVVDVFDLALLATIYARTTGGSWSKGDFNVDGAVDVYDLALMAGRYGFGTDVDAGAIGGGEGLTVPEPATMIFLALGAAAALRRRRRA